MKKISCLIAFPILLVLMFLAQGCSKSSSTVSDLLRTVPSSAAGVAVIDLESVKDSFGENLQSGARSDTAALNLTELLSLCVSDRAGVDISSAVIFVDGYDTIFTAVVDNPDIFINAVAKKYNLQFSSNEGFSIAEGKVAVKGTQFWVSLSGQNLDASKLEGFLSLSEQKSYLSTDGGKELAENSNLLSFNADFDTLLNLYSDGDFTRQAQSRIVMSTLFDDLSRLSGYMKFEKGELNIEFSLLDSKGRPTRFNLDTKKIDVKTLASIGGNAGILFGIGVSKKMIDQIMKAAASFGGAMPQIYSEALKPIDGTCGIAVSSDTPGMSGVLTTKSDSTQGLSSLLAGDAKIRKEGNLLYFTTGGEMKGALDVETDAELLKGSFFGFVSDASPVVSMLGATPSSNLITKVDKGVFGFYQEGNGVKIKVRIIFNKQ